MKAVSGDPVRQGAVCPEVLGASLRQARLRVSRHYEVRSAESLSQVERDRLQISGGSTGFLQPTGSSGLVAKSIDASTLDLLEHFSRPAHVPDEALEFAPFIVGLILDGVLEIWDGARFICGPLAARELFALAIREPGGVVAAMTRRAIRHVFRLGIRESPVLASALYRYNTIPMSSCRFEEMQNVDSFLGLSGTNVRTTRLLGSLWERVPESESPGWISWRPRKGSELPRYKLYLSPAPQAVREAFGVLVSVLSELGSVDFKIGYDGHGLLRPDKIVVYFADAKQLRAVGTRLGHRLRDCPVQGVPFTAELAGDGLVSWGADPPHMEAGSVPGRPESWRLWLTKRVATTLSVALFLAPDRDPWPFVALRLKVDGVDPDTWAPSEAIRKEWTRAWR